MEPDTTMEMAKECTLRIGPAVSRNKHLACSPIELDNIGGIRHHLSFAIYGLENIDESATVMRSLESLPNVGRALCLYTPGEEVRLLELMKRDTIGDPHHFLNFLKPGTTYLEAAPNMLKLMRSVCDRPSIYITLQVDGVSTTVLMLTVHKGDLGVVAANDLMPWLDHIKVCRTVGEMSDILDVETFNAPFLWEAVFEVRKYLSFGR